MLKHAETFKDKTLDKFSEDVRRAVARNVVNAVAGFLQDGSIVKGEKGDDADFGYLVERVHSQIQGDDALNKMGFEDESEAEMYLVDTTADGMIAIAEGDAVHGNEKDARIPWPVFVEYWGQFADITPIRG